MYEIVMMDPLDTSTLSGSISEKNKKIAEFYTQATEQIIYRHPEQWLWMHRRWKTRPPEEVNNPPLGHG
jgi:KDO2-lipid IV(A) lauroyltransferase